MGPAIPAPEINTLMRQKYAWLALATSETFGPVSAEQSGHSEGRTSDSSDNALILARECFQGLRTTMGPSLTIWIAFNEAVLPIDCVKSCDARKKEGDDVEPRPVFLVSFCLERYATLTIQYLRTCRVGPHWR